MLHRNVALCGAETWALQKVYQKYLERFDLRCWGRLEKNSGRIAWEM